MKTKTSLWLSICTMVLCLGAMAMGVYSLVTSSLTMGGTLGFNMHNALVQVSGSISNVADLLDDNTYIKTTKTIDNAVMGSETSTTSTNIPLGKLEFFKNENMIFDFTFTNLGEMAVSANFAVSYENQNVVFVEGNDYVTLPYSTNIPIDGSTRICFALKLNDQTDQMEEFNFTITANFEQVEAIIDHDIVQPVISSSYENFHLSQNADGKTYTATLSGDPPFFRNLEEYYIPSQVKINEVVYYITVVDFMEYQAGAFYECNNVYICSGIQEVKNLYVDNIDNLHISKNLKKLTNCNFANSGLDQENNIIKFYKDTIDLTIETCTFEINIAIDIGENSNISFAEGVNFNRNAEININNGCTISLDTTFFSQPCTINAGNNCTLSFSTSDFSSKSEINIGEGCDVSFDEGTTFNASPTINILYQNVNVEFNGTGFYSTEGSIFINLTTPPTGITFVDCYFDSEIDFGIYVPTGYENAYKSAPNFASVAGYIKGYDFSA